MIVLKLLKDPKFNDSLELRYCMTWIESYERSNSQLWHFMHALNWFMLWILGLAFSIDQVFLNVFAIGSLSLGPISVYIALRSKNLKILRYSQLILFLIVNILFCGATYWDVIATPRIHFFLPAAWIVGACAGYVILPFRSRIHIASLVVTTSLALLAFSQYQKPLFWAIGFLTLTASFSNIQVFIHRIIKLNAIDSFRQQKKFTPTQVILAALEQNKSPEEVFHPEKRFSVCLCSDWRSFQEWSSKTESEVMASTLRQYYEIQLALLAKNFPDGNYFMDWIADELFAVGFSTSNQNETKVVQSMFGYAADSLNELSAFKAIHGCPVGVDMGMSIGIATVGAVGPIGGIKTTALGEVPGLARRLQTFAKTLRASSQRDRLVLPKSVMVHLSKDACSALDQSEAIGQDIRNVEQIDLVVFSIKQQSKETINPPKQIESKQGAHEAA